MANVSFWASASYKQFKSLALQSQEDPVLKTVL